jgi:hypothetical protein
MASHIYTYSPTIIQGLLQTPRFAESLRRHRVDQQSLEQFLELLRIRQAVFFDAEQPRGIFIVDESALRRLVGGRDVMREQLQRLKDVAGFERFELKVMPFAAGAHPSLSGPMVILEFQDDDPEALFLEDPRGATFIREDAALIAQYKAKFEYLNEIAWSEQRSIEFIDQLIDEYSAAAA